MRPAPRGTGNATARARAFTRLRSFNEAGPARDRKRPTASTNAGHYLTGFNEAGPARDRKRTHEGAQGLGRQQASMRPAPRGTGNVFFGVKVSHDSSGFNEAGPARDRKRTRTRRGGRP